MLSLTTFLSEVKARKVRKTMAIYLSSALTAIGIVRLFVDVYDLPRWLFPVVVTVLTCSVGNACVFAWYHGVEGSQKFRTKEFLLHGLFVIAAVVLSVRIAGAPPVTLTSVNLKSVAVLPFKNLSDSKEDEYFSDGITEDIIAQLSKIGSLQVISRTSVMKYKNSEKNLREIGQDLSVAAILEGTVRRAGDRVRIVAQLIDARSDRHLWADTYDREMKDIFAIQSEVAKNIAAALRATLSPSEQQQIEKKHTENLDAYAYYLRGREYYYRYTKEDNERAIDMYSKALALDPRYALAYAGLGDAYDRRWWFGFPDEWSDSAISASNTAISFDPNLAEGYEALGNALQSRGEYRRAMDLYRTAVKLNPSYALAVSNLGSVCLDLGELDEAVVWFKKVVVLQPGFARWSSNLAVAYFYLEYDSLATRWFDKAIELQPDFIFPYVVLAFVQIYAGRYDLAGEYINKALSITPDASVITDAAGDLALIKGQYLEARQLYEKSLGPGAILGSTGIKLACALRGLGDLKRSNSILDSNIAAHGGGFDELREGSPLPYYVAAAHSLKGDTVQAIRWLKKGVDLGYRDRRLLLIDPLFENVRSTSQFKEILEDLSRRIEKMRSRVEHIGVTG